MAGTEGRKGGGGEREGREREGEGEEGVCKLIPEK